MSYILEALKKSEEQRQGGDAVAPLSQRPEFSIKIPAIKNKWAVIFTALAFNVVVVSWLMFGDFFPAVTPIEPQADLAPKNVAVAKVDSDSKPLAQVVVAPKSKPQANQSSLRELAAKSKPSVSSVPKPAAAEPVQPTLKQLAEQQRQQASNAALPTPPPMPVAPAPVVKPTPVQKAPVVNRSPAEPPAPVAVVKPQPQPIAVTPAPSPKPASSPVRESQVITPRPKVAETTRISQQVTPANQTAKVAEDDVPLLTELDIDFQRSVPTLNVNVHVYSDVPEERFVLIDMTRYSEGTALPGAGPEVVEITPTGIIFSHRGKEFMYLVR